MVSKSKACENFLEKRKKLMQQVYIENEYKKRNFLLKNVTNKYLDVVFVEFLYMQYLDNISYLEELEECLISHFFNKEYGDLSFVSKEMSKKIINAEIMSRKKYELAFYALPHLNCIYDVLKKNNYENTLMPVIPHFVNGDKIIDNNFIKAVFTYECTDYEDITFFQCEKDALEIEFKKILDGKRSSGDVSLLAAIIACRNGEDLDDSQFDVLSSKIEKMLIDNVRSNSLESRLKGILYFDYQLALASAGIKCSDDKFIKQFSDILREPSKKFYDKKVKKTYKDSLRNAQHCIAEGKMLKINNKRKLLKFSRLELPKFLPRYDEMVQECMETNNCDLKLKKLQK